MLCFLIVTVESGNNQRFNDGRIVAREHTQRNDQVGTLFLASCNPRRLCKRCHTPRPGQGEISRNLDTFRTATRFIKSIERVTECRNDNVGRSVQGSQFRGSHHALLIGFCRRQIGRRGLAQPAAVDPHVAQGVDCLFSHLRIVGFQQTFDDRNDVIRQDTTAQNLRDIAEQTLILCVA